MVLVPEGLLMELKGKLPKSPDYQATLGLGYELDHIQDREDLTPREKVSLYGQELARYRHYLERARNEGKISIPAPPDAPPAVDGAAAAAPPPQPPQPTNLDQAVLDNVQQSQRKKAELLLNHLKKSKIVRWVEQGQISYRGKPIPHSNIIDLMGDTMRLRARKSRPKPAGMMEFAQGLKENFTPHDYVGNPEVIKAMQKPGKISTPKGLGDDSDQDDTGFMEASSLTPIKESFLETPTSKRKKSSRKHLDPSLFSSEIKKWSSLPKKK